MRGGHYVAYVRRQGAWFAHIQTWKLAHAFGADSCGRIFLDTRLAVISRSLPGKEMGFFSLELRSWQRHKSQFIVSPPLSARGSKEETPVRFERPMLQSRAELFYYIASRSCSPQVFSLSSNTGAHGNNSRFLCSVVERPPNGPQIWYRPLLDPLWYHCLSALVLF